MKHDYDPIDEAYATFARTGPEFGGGLSNHGPMAAEALAAMHRGDAVGKPLREAAGAASFGVVANIGG